MGRKMQDQNNEKKEKVWKFDGRHANLKVFNRCVMTELEAEDRLAAAILRGNIAIKETQTVMGSIVTHIGCIMTQIMLTIMIVLAVNPEQMERDLKLAYEKSADRKKYKTVIAKLRDHHAATIDDTAAINEELRVIRENDKTKMTEQELKDLLTYLDSLESEEHQATRYNNGKLTTQEYLDYGFIDVNEKQRKRFLKTGKIPKAVLQKSIAIINKTVNKYCTHKLLREPRLQTMNGQAKTGIEIYNTLQKPSENMIVNVLYLNDKIQKLMVAETKNVHSYHRYLTDLMNQRSEAIRSMELQLNEHEIIAICQTLSKLTGSAENLSSKNALLQLDYKKITSPEEFAQHLLQHTTTIANQKRANRDNTTASVNNNRNGGGRNGGGNGGNRRKPTCFACGGQHYLSDCRNEDKKAELKRTKPETYAKYIKPPRARNAPAKTNAMTDNPDGEQLCTAVIHNINATKADNWILDSGSTTNMTSDKTALSSIVQEQNVIKTPIGKKVLTEKGDLNSYITNVLVNPNSDINLVSVTKYLHDHKDSGIMLTRNAAYEIDHTVVTKTPYKRVLADQVNNLYHIREDVVKSE